VKIGYVVLAERRAKNRQYISLKKIANWCTFHNIAKPRPRRFFVVLRLDDFVNVLSHMLDFVSHSLLALRSSDLT